MCQMNYVRALCLSYTVSVRHHVSVHHHVFHLLVAAVVYQTLPMVDENCFDTA